jgi:hypothetical protein
MVPLSDEFRKVEKVEASIEEDDNVKKNSSNVFKTSYITNAQETNQFNFGFNSKEGNGSESTKSKTLLHYAPPTDLITIVRVS